MPDRPGVDYVFGYGSLVALRTPLVVDGVSYPTVPGRLRGFGRCWGVAMNNWEAAPRKKHYLDRGTRRAPRVRIAFLDLEEKAGVAANGLAIPVDAAQLAAFDAREVNYERIEVSAALQPRLPGRVFVYRGTKEARARRYDEKSGTDICVSSEYVAAVRQAFADLAEGALAEFDLTTTALPFPRRDLVMVQPPVAAGDDPEP